MILAVRIAIKLNQIFQSRLKELEVDPTMPVPIRHAREKELLLLMRLILNPKHYEDQSVNCPEDVERLWKESNHQT
jgi:hypothetical protein